MSDILPMSKRELERAPVLRHLDAGYLRQRQAAERLDLTTRQVRRLLRAYREGGNTALGSKQCGQPSHLQLDPTLKRPALGVL